MRKAFAFCVIIILFASCGDRKSQAKHLTYQNIVLLADLSSRIDNMPLKDSAEIHTIVDFFKNECVKPGEKIGDKSRIAFSAFSEKGIACIDIDQIKNLGEKQQFINSTGKYVNSGLDHQIDSFEQKVRYAYATIRNEGLDLISVLVDKIENEGLVKKSAYLTDGIDTTFINYENHLYVFTDGYLEYVNKTENDQFYFGALEIDEVRRFCKENDVDLLTALKVNESLCLPVIKSSNHSYVNLHVYETHERDKNTKLQTYKYPKGLRDNEILEGVWRKWAMESGFNSFEWRKY